jgi:hypothetical protein
VKGDSAKSIIVTDILEIIFTDAVWLSKHKDKEVSFVDSLYDKFSDEEKIKFAESLNYSLYSAINKIILSHDLDDAGANQWLVNFFLPKKLGKREMSQWLWSTGCVSYNPDTSSIGYIYKLPGYPTRSLDALLATSISSSFLFKGSYDQTKNSLTGGKDGAREKDAELTPYFFKSIHKLKHGEFFDINSFSVVLTGQDTSYTSEKVLYNSLVQRNITAALKIIKKHSCSNSFKNDFSVAEGDIDLGSDIFDEMFKFAKERAAILTAARVKDPSLPIFVLTDVNSEKLRKSGMQRFHGVYNAEFCAQYYDGRKLPQLEIKIGGESETLEQVNAGTSDKPEDAMLDNSAVMEPQNRKKQNHHQQFNFLEKNDEGMLKNYYSLIFIVVITSLVSFFWLHQTFLATAFIAAGMGILYHAHKLAHNPTGSFTFNSVDGRSEESFNIGQKTGIPNNVANKKSHGFEVDNEKIKRENT